MSSYTAGMISGIVIGAAIVTIAWWLVAVVRDWVTRRRNRRSLEPLPDWPPPLAHYIKGHRW